MNNGRITVFAELTRKQLGQLQGGEVELEIPYGSEMGRPIGKRGLIFYCSNKKSAKELVDGLHSSGVNYQIQEGSIK